MDERVGVAEPLDEGERHVHRGFVHADEHAAAAQVAQLLDGRLGLFRQAQQPLGIVSHFEYPLAHFFLSQEILEIEQQFTETGSGNSSQFQLGFL